MNLDIIVYCAAILYISYSIFSFLYFLYKSLSYITSFCSFVFDKCKKCCMMVYSNHTKQHSKKKKNTFIELKETELPFYKYSMN